MSEKCAKTERTRVNRWYFGGLASSLAACCTHPIDLLKVHLQTHQEKLHLIPLTIRIVKKQGILALYSGLSASVLRQMTYSLARFGIYESGSEYIDTHTFLGKIVLASLAGTIGGFVGTPSDMVNVRMQNDVKLPPSARRNYKHAIDGLIQVYNQEGFRKLFSGATPTIIRGLFMTVGQIAFYDQIKTILVERLNFEDKTETHILASFCAATIATTLTQPIDVIKTRTMNSKPGEFKGILDVIKYTAHLGPLGFFKGYVPAFIRLGPHTILTFVILEQLRLNFGIIAEPKKKA